MDVTRCPCRRWMVGMEAPLPCRLLLDSGAAAATLLWKRCRRRVKPWKGRKRAFCGEADDVAARCVGAPLRAGHERSEAGSATVFGGAAAALG